MAKVKCKGTVLKQEISSVYTAVAQVIEFSMSGVKDETYDATDLSTTKFKEKASTGYAEPGESSFTLFLDPALAGHQAILALIGSGNTTNWKLICADDDESEIAFSSAGVEVGVEVKMNDGLKMPVKLEHTGAVTFPD